MGKEGKPTVPQGAPVARLDKWLWAARIFKTRSIAAGEVVSVRKPPVTYSFKVLKCIEQRVGAKLLPEIYENVTDPKQYEILEMSRISGFVDRARGTGRPTKKDRRAMEAFVDPAMFGFDDLDDDFEGFDDDDFNS